MARSFGRGALRTGCAVWLFALVLPAHADPAAPPVQVAQASPDTAAADIGRVTPNGGSAGPEALQAKPSGTGTRAQAKAAEHAAINKIIVQPESEIQKLPDISVAQALSRLPGVSMETDSGEGRFIDIRGLDAYLNAATFDGVRIMPSNLSSPTGGGRAVAYDVLPAGLIGGIEVSETLRPEDDAEALGGLVNLLPRRPPSDGQPFVKATAGMGLQFLRDTQIIDYGINAGASFSIQTGQGRFDHPVSGSGFLSNPKPFSFFITDTQHNDCRGIDDFERVRDATPYNHFSLLRTIEDGLAFPATWVTPVTMRKASWRCNRCLPSRADGQYLGWTCHPAKLPGFHVSWPP